VKIVKAEDLKVGDKIVIMRPPDEGNHNLHGYVGGVLDVLAVDPPFVVAADVGFPESRFPIDTRRFEIGIPSEDYVAALTRKSGKKIV
jgi:hypothetical protein